MKLKYLQALAAAVAILAITGLANVAQAGFATPQPSEPVPFNGSDLSVTEDSIDNLPLFINPDGDPVDFRPALEFTINNPESGPIGAIFGMMVAISDLDLTAVTENPGWDDNTLDSALDLANFLTDSEFGLDEDLFSDFVFDGDDVILAFFTEQEDALVTPGTSLGGFYGIDFNSERSDVALFGTGGTCVGQTNQPCGGDSTSVPEPGTLALVGLGLVGLAAVRRRRKLAA